MAPSSSSTFWAAWRQGLKDLQNVAINPFPQHVATHEEMGTIANPTPQLVTQNIRSEEDFDDLLSRYTRQPKSDSQRLTQHDVPQQDIPQQDAPQQRQRLTR